MMNALGAMGMAPPTMQPMAQPQAMPTPQTETIGGNRQVGMVPGVQGSMGLNPAMQFPQQGFGQFRNALMDFRQQRFDPSQGWHPQMMAWMQHRMGGQLPFNPGGPIMTPGGTGAPMQGGQMSTNPVPLSPTAGQMPTTSYQLPTY